MNKYIVGLVLSLFCLSRSDAVIFNPKEFTLPNGMRCIVIENHTTPAVFHSLWVKAGGSDEKPGDSGIAHFLEHLMFRGTKKFGPGVYDKTIHRLGGENNAFTTQDQTVYHVKIAKEHLPKIMELEADRLTGLHITDEIFDTEKKVILEERHSRIDNEPFSILNEQLLALLYLHHPYKIPVIGWAHEIKSLTRENVMSFYQTNYAPNNVILIIAGDVTIDEVKPLAEKYYGPLAPSQLLERIRTQEPPAWVEKKTTLYHSQVQQPQFIRYYRAPILRLTEPAKIAAIEVLAEIIGGSQTSKLYKKLVMEQKQAVAVNVGYHSDRLDEGLFMVTATPAPGIDPVILEVSIDTIINQFLATGITDEELNRIKSKLEADAIYARDSLEKGAKAIGFILTAGGKISDVEEWETYLRAVTKEMVLEAAQEIFNPLKAITGYLRPKA